MNSFGEIFHCKETQKRGRGVVRPLKFLCLKLVLKYKVKLTKVVELVETIAAFFDIKLEGKVFLITSFAKRASLLY